MKSLLEKSSRIENRGEKLRFPEEYNVLDTEIIAWVHLFLFLSRWHVVNTRQDFEIDGISQRCTNEYDARSVLDILIARQSMENVLWER